MGKGDGASTVIPHDGGVQSIAQSDTIPWLEAQEIGLRENASGSGHSEYLAHADVSGTHPIQYNKSSGDISEHAHRTSLVRVTSIEDSSRIRFEGKIAGSAL